MDVFGCKGKNRGVGPLAMVQLCYVEDPVSIQIRE